MVTQQSERSRIWVSHPFGNSNVRGVLEAFESAGLLDAFFTCIGTGKDSRNGMVRRLLARRDFPVPQARLRTHPTRELLRQLNQRFGLAPKLNAHETGMFSVDHIMHALDRSVARSLERSAPPAAIYAYEDGALASFQSAARAGVKRIYDLPIGYWRAARRIQTEEAELNPEWAATMPALRDSDRKVARKDEELQQSDAIFVASQFTASTLAEAPFDLPKPVVIPYGCPISTASGPAKANERKGQRLRVLFVGGLSQRKGLSYLLDAVRGEEKALELTLIGRRSAECRPLQRATEQYTWIESLPHPQILEQMRQHDVFVFPSLFEGFGLVLTEALASGIPIISTAHTCAPDIIEDGREGFIVPIRDADAIRSKLLALHEDRDRLNGMKEAAKACAAGLTWQRYREGTLAATREELGTTTPTRRLAPTANNQRAKAST